MTEFSAYPSQPVETMIHLVYFKDYSKAAEKSYWMNHCIFCGIKQGDNALHHPGQAFWPLTISAIERLKVYSFNQPISVRCDRIEFPCLDEIISKTAPSMKFGDVTSIFHCK